MDGTLHRPITTEEIEAYRRDGIVCLRGFFDMDWVEHLREMIDLDMADPSEMRKNVDADEEGSGFFYDTFIAHHMEGFRKAAFSSPAAEIAATLMGADKVNLLFDQLLIKDPGATTRTVWHHDSTYWPIAGDQVSSLWLALDPVSYDTGAVEYVKGSHRWGERYLAISFNPKETYTEDLPPVPDIEAERDKHDIVWYDMEPGDCTVHHGLTVHGAPGNDSDTVRRRAYVTRWMGDDVTYNPRPNLMRMLRDPEIPVGGPLDCDLFPVVWRAQDNT